MISEEYKKAVDIIRAECLLEHDVEKIVAVFQMLIENGHYAGDDDIYQYIIDYGKHREETTQFIASKIQDICETVKATLEPETDHWNRDWLHKELLGK